MLTVQILIGDDEECIGRTIESIRKQLNGVIPYEIVAGDTGCKDRTAVLCTRAGCRMVQARGRRDAARNAIVDNSKNDWHLHLEAGEILADLGAIFAKLQAKEGGTYTIIQGGIASKQVRLQHRSHRFINPIFERWEGNTGEPMGLIFAPTRDTYSRDLVAAQQWIDKSPQDPNARYYMACIRLGMRDFQAFLRDAENYLFAERSPAAYMPMTMTRYYCSTVQCYVNKDATKATQNIVACLAAAPLMAEFWCLAGDIRYYLTKEYAKAVLLYENAIELGSRRLKSDPFPMEIAKYQEYPFKMIESCRRIIAASTAVTGNR